MGPEVYVDEDARREWVAQRMCQADMGELRREVEAVHGAHPLGREDADPAEVVAYMKSMFGLEDRSGE